jgi:hypothetical protein
VSTATSHNSISHFKRLFQLRPGTVFLLAIASAVIVFFWLFPSEPFYYEQLRSLGQQEELKCLTANGNASSESYAPCVESGLMVTRIAKLYAGLIAILFMAGLACAAIQFLYPKDSGQRDTMDEYASFLLYMTISAMIAMAVLFVSIKFFQLPFLPTRPAPDFEISQLRK